jgi:hypothetical protein
LRLGEAAAFKPKYFKNRNDQTYENLSGYRAAAVLLSRC